ncbi:TPA: hypothetical protein I8271_003901 [Kluyvera intermedia]|nr:hypothetical protein [Kluyvera intermedia]HAT2681882.1 hypothetical protein [Kluyvera intermedia]HAT2698499.1 hypothetical protein [Kluyvera intermedia]HAT2709156.1 hypothetical protein [Kluyvera intermedia]
MARASDIGVVARIRRSRRIRDNSRRRKACRATRYGAGIRYRGGSPDKAVTPHPGQLPATQSFPGYKGTVRVSDVGVVARIRRSRRIRDNSRRRKACQATRYDAGIRCRGGSPDKAVTPHPGQLPAAQSLPGYKGTVRASDVGVVARIRRLRRIRERGQGKAIKR